MTAAQSISRIGAALLLLASLSACTIVPAYPVGVRAAPVYAEPYYGRPYGNTYYGNSAPRHDYDRGYYREAERRDYYRQEPRQESPVRIPSPLEVHRDVRRSLGLPRLPGMP